MNKQHTDNNNSQYRKYLLTINNPEKNGYSWETLWDIMAAMKVNYWCYSEEIGASGTRHIHIFFYRKTAIRWKTVAMRFPKAHITSCDGSVRENRDYVRKGGVKWEGTEKAETSIEGTFKEFGVIPIERETKSAYTSELLADIEGGKRISDIIRENPNLMFKSNDIGILRETFNADYYMEHQRDVEVSYLFGPTGSGKTSSIFNAFPSREICRITDYNGSNVRFDAYHGQDVLVFEEFHGQVLFESLLNYIDRYPIWLPARYSNRVACFTKVFFTTNVPLSDQYRDIQENYPAKWEALLRRINKVIEFKPDGTTVEHDMNGGNH